MKKINLLVTALTITMLASCGKSNGGYSTTSSESTTPAHKHAYNAAGLCECGDYLGKELTFDEAYGDDVPTLSVYSGNKVYFTWTTECKSVFEIDEMESNSVPSSTPEEEFKRLYTNIEVYKDGNFTTNVLDTIGLLVDVDDDGDEKYYWYTTEDYLDAESTYYAVITLAEEMEQIGIYTLITSTHDLEYSWNYNEETGTRTSTSVCPNCGNQVTVEEEAINEISIPLVKFESGKTFRENFDRIGFIDCEGKCIYYLYGVKGYSSDLLVDSHITYEVNAYLYPNDNYYFPQSFILRDYLGNPFATYNVNGSGYAVTFMVNVSC